MDINGTLLVLEVAEIEFAGSCFRDQPVMPARTKWAAQVGIEGRLNVIVVLGFVLSLEETR